MVIVRIYFNHRAFGPEEIKDRNTHTIENFTPDPVASTQDAPPWTADPRPFEQAPRAEPSAHRFFGPWQSGNPATLCSCLKKASKTDTYIKVWGTDHARKRSVHLEGQSEEKCPQPVQMATSLVLVYGEPSLLHLISPRGIAASSFPQTHFVERPEMQGKRSHTKIGSSVDS